MIEDVAARTDCASSLQLCDYARAQMITGATKIPKTPKSSEYEL